MSMSWTSSSGYSLSYSTSGTESGSTLQTLDYQSAAGVSSEPVEETDGTAMVVSGEAFAVGDETVATGDIDLEINDMGTTTVASGSSTFEASSMSGDGDTAYASADTKVAVSSGEKTISWNFDSSSTLQTEDVSEWSASSTTDALAIYQDGEDAGSTGSGTTSKAESESETPQATGDPETAGFELDEAQFTWDYDSGNIAMLDIDAAAYGQDTFISVDASMLTVEDELSAVSGIVIGAVG
jgi:hypothetical protein